MGGDRASYRWIPAFKYFKVIAGTNEYLSLQVLSSQNDGMDQH
jgi:hypothetical protein